VTVDNMIRLIPADQFTATILDFTESAFRAERQRFYFEEPEEDLRLAFERGDAAPPVIVPHFQNWYDRVQAHIRAGHMISRVRVQQDPPSIYQQYLRWLGIWNERAGEVLTYLTEQQAHDLDLLQDAATDWWLLDAGTPAERLVVMHFDDEGRRVKNELVTDPHAVQAATRWRDRAVLHAVRDRRPPDRATERHGSA
jgi:hypothetical protein